MPQWLRVLGLACLVGLAGCSSVPVNQAQGASKAGRAYVDTLQKVNTYALNSSLEFTANLLPNLPRNAQTLEVQTTAMTARVDLLNQASAYFDKLEQYFVALEALAQADDKSALSKATAKAVGELADSLKAPPVGLRLSAADKTSLTGLAAFVVERQHNAALDEALKRDADVVARAVALSQAMLDEQIIWIERREKLDQQLVHDQEVEKPFVDDKKLSASWKKAWIAQVKPPPSIALLEQAKKASRDMQAAWLQVLNGSAVLHPEAQAFAGVQDRLADMKQTIQKLKEE